jgi:hypothetical protein
MPVPVASQRSHLSDAASWRGASARHLHGFSLLIERVVPCRIPGSNSPLDSVKQDVQSDVVIVPPTRHRHSDKVVVFHFTERYAPRPASGCDAVTASTSRSATGGTRPRSSALVSFCKYQHRTSKQTSPYNRSADVTGTGR